MGVGSIGATGPTAAKVGTTPWHDMDPITHPVDDDECWGRRFSLPRGGFLGTGATAAINGLASGSGHPASGFFPFLQQRTIGFANLLQQHLVRHMSAFRQPQP